MTIDPSTLDKRLISYVPAAPRAVEVGSAEKAQPNTKALSIPSLDGLRAISFLIVFLSHAGVPGMPGGFGVTVFFFLSGYLITTLLRQEVEQTGTVSLKLFYLRRVLRILPPFYLVLVLATLLTAYEHPGYLQLAPVAAQFLHYGNYWFAFNDWNGIGTGTGVYWSLAIEEHFYFVFPALYLVLQRAGWSGSRMAAVFWALCGATLVWRCYLVFGADVPFHRVAVASDTRADSILLGCALAVWNNPALSPPAARMDRRSVLLLLGALLLLTLTFTIRSDAFRETFRYTLQGIALYPIFIAAIRYAKLGPYKFLNTWVLRRLGVLSYSLYLVHHTVLEVLGPRLPDSVWLRVVVGLTCSVMLAQAIYLLIEKPCAELRKRLGSRA